MQSDMALFAFSYILSQDCSPSGTTGSELLLTRYHPQASLIGSLSLCIFSDSYVVVYSAVLENI